jgi:hypothetical protein
MRWTSQLRRLRFGRSLPAAYRAAICRGGPFVGDTNRDGGLLLTHRKLFLGFGSYGDFTIWHVWLFAYKAASLTQVGYFCNDPGSSQPSRRRQERGAIW